MTSRPASPQTTKPAAGAQAQPPASPTGEQAWTTRRLLEWMKSAFSDAKIDSPKLCAEILLAHVLRCERMRLYMDVDRVATDSERAILRSLAGRALRHEPIQYLVGEWWFFGNPFKVDARVLIPRPSTETLVQCAIDHVRARDGVRASDSGDPPSPEPTSTEQDVQHSVTSGPSATNGAELTFVPLDVPIEIAPSASDDDDEEPDDDGVVVASPRQPAAPARDVAPARPVSGAEIAQAFDPSSVAAGRDAIASAIAKRASARARSASAGATIIDLCTGSGCVAIALAREVPGARVIAVDMSREALQVAAENAHRLGVQDRVRLIEGDARDPALYAKLVRDPWLVSRGGADAVVANPPYIPDAEWEGVAKNVKDFEPELALRGGRDGLDVVRPVISHAGGLVVPGGLLAIEVATSHAPAVQDEVLACGRFDRARTIDDCDGLARVVCAVRR